MARGGGKGRNYTRDANGRFSSGGGGGASKRSTPASRRAAKPKALGGTLATRSRLRAAKAKLVPGASSQQKAAVTRAQNNLKAAKQSNRRRMNVAPRKGVIRPGKGRKAAPPSSGPKLLPPGKARPLLPPARSGAIVKRQGAPAAVRAVAAAGARTFVAGQMARARVDQAVAAVRKRLGGKGKRKR